MGFKTLKGRTKVVDRDYFEDGNLPDSFFAPCTVVKGGGWGMKTTGKQLGIQEYKHYPSGVI
jgi:hypothetical protein